MRIRNQFLIAVLGLTIFSACKKDSEEAVLAPSIKMANETSAINGKINEAITLKATNTLGNQISQEWLVNAEVKSNTAILEFTPAKSGVYNITYNATNSAGVFKFDYVLTVAVPETPTTITSNRYVTNFFEYAPAAGQFMNEGGWGIRKAENLSLANKLPQVFLWVLSVGTLFMVSTILLLINQRKMIL
jgi:hypothetical protein